MKATFSLKHAKEELGPYTKGLPADSITVQSDGIVLSLGDCGIFFFHDGMLLPNNPYFFNPIWGYQAIPPNTTVTFVQE